MIVTRQRRKTFNWKKLILPVIAIALLIFAILWGPSRGFISNGPMAPMFGRMGSWFDTASVPFHFAAQNQVITDRNRQIAILQEQLTSAQDDSSGKDKKIAALTAQVDQLQQQVASARNTNGSKAASPAPSATQAAAAGDFGAAGAQSSTPTSAELQRTAQYWASMDPENAAKLVQRLPPAYVARAFALMSPDSVGAILDALPAAYAAKLTQEHPL